MVAFNEIRNARREGQVQTVRAWLDSNEYTNDKGATLLHEICLVAVHVNTTEADVDIARLLLSRGVDANHCEHGDGWTLLHNAAQSADNERGRRITALLIAAGADVNARTEEGSTPLGTSLDDNIFTFAALHNCLEIATLLLRAGASLDACCQTRSAEDLLDALLDLPGWGNDLPSDPNFLALKTLFAGVRRAGSWKLWTLEDVKALLRLRSLVASGRARDIKRLRARRPREITLLFAPAFPKELFWKVMTYWNPRY